MRRRFNKRIRTKPLKQLILIVTLGKLQKCEWFCDIAYRAGHCVCRILTGSSKKIIVCRMKSVAYLGSRQKDEARGRPRGGGKGGQAQSPSVYNATLQWRKEKNKPIGGRPSCLPQIGLCIYTHLPMFSHTYNKYIPMDRAHLQSLPAHLTTYLPRSWTSVALLLKYNSPKTYIEIILNNVLTYNTQ